MWQSFMPEFLFFLQANHVTDTLEFDMPLLPASVLYTFYVTHLRHNLPGERG